VVIAIDALDEVDRVGTSHAANPLFLPFDLPENVYVVMSARNREDVSFEVSRIQEWDLAPGSDGNEDAIREFVATWLSRSGVKSWMKAQRLDRGGFIDHLVAKSEENFMYLHHALPAIERGEYSTGGIDELPHGLRAYYRRHWAQMQEAGGADFEQSAKPVVCVLATVQEPVPVEMLAEVTQLEASQIRNVLKEWQEFLHVETVTKGGARYRVYHTAFRDYLQEEVDPGLRRYHALIATSLLGSIQGGIDLKRDE